MDLINSIFKHSQGYVMQKYANHKDEHHVTDVYGVPEKGKHILHKEHTCSDKQFFNIAAAYRQGTNGANAGMCFKDTGDDPLMGQSQKTSNCICNDKSGTFQLNKCPGEYGNLRRYGSAAPRGLLHAGCSTVGLGIAVRVLC